MNRMIVRAPALNRRRPLRARRAIAKDAVAEYEAERPAPRWLIAGVGVLGALVAVELAVGIAVLA